ncbi:hypothetical protein FA10DRAFT_296821, partial [Acaromyces ingoldii]
RLLSLDTGWPASTNKIQQPSRKKRSKLDNASQLSTATDSCFTMRLLSASLYTSLFALCLLVCVSLSVNAMKIPNSPSWRESVSSVSGTKQDIGTWESKLDNRNEDKAWTNAQQKWVPKSTTSSSVSSLLDKPKAWDGIFREIVTNKRRVPETPLTQPHSGSADGVVKSRFGFRNYPAKGESRGRDCEKSLVDEQTDDPPSKRSGESKEDLEEQMRKAMEVLDPMKLARLARGKNNDIEESNATFRLSAEAQQILEVLQIGEHARAETADKERADRNFLSLEGPTTSIDEEEGSSTSSVSTGRKSKKQNKKKQQGGRGKDKKH